MPRRPSPTFFQPSLVAGQAWAGFQVSRGAPLYPKVVFNSLYYVCNNPIVTPVHAKQLAIDFIATTAWLNLRLITPALSAMELAPIYLWDGTVLHTYPVELSAPGLYPLGVTGRALGVSFTKRTATSSSFPKIVGRTCISPLPLIYMAGHDRLTVGAVSDLINLGQSLFHDTFTSEGYTWHPAIMSNLHGTIQQINQVTLYRRLTQFRRRLRIAPWTAQLVLPPPFPTGTG